MNWKDFTIRAWRAGFRWVAFNVHHIWTREAKCFKSAIDADQYCMSKNNDSTDWQFDHLGNIKTYINAASKCHVDWNDLCGKLSDFNIEPVTPEQHLISQLADGLYCMATIRKPYLPFLSFKQFKIVTIHDSNSNEGLYDDYLEALIKLNECFTERIGRIIKLYGTIENTGKEFAEILFTISSVQNPESAAFDSFCDPTLMIFREQVVFIRYKLDQSQLEFYDEFSKKYTWHTITFHFNLQNFYALQENKSKFRNYE